MAAEVAAQSSTDEAAGRLISARHKHRRTCAYYILAERYLDSTDEQKPVAYRALQREFAAFAACAGEPVEHVEVPYEDTGREVNTPPANAGIGSTWPSLG